TLPPYRRHRYDSYADAPTTIPLAPRWNQGFGRSITERVLQQSFTHFVNVHQSGSGSVTTQELDAALDSLDAAILAVNLLGATRGFRYAEASDDTAASKAGWGGDSVTAACRAPVPADEWLDELRAVVARGDIGFAGILSAPRAGFFRHPVGPTCADVYRDA